MLAKLLIVPLINVARDARLPSFDLSARRIIEILSRRRTISLINGDAHGQLNALDGSTEPNSTVCQAPGV